MQEAAHQHPLQSVQRPFGQALLVAPLRRSAG
jgi:hypothetical protein